MPQLETVPMPQCTNFLSNPKKKDFMATKAEKLMKLQKFSKLQKLSIFKFMFAVPKQIADKMVTKSCVIL